MNGRVRGIFRLFVGGYLIYLGVSLAASVIKAKPNNYVMFIICGIIFAAVGLVIVIKNIKPALTPQVSEDSDEPEEEEGIDQEDIVQPTIMETEQEIETEESEEQLEEVLEDESGE